ncbi:MAG: hypothetical protein ACQRW7_06300 [Caulobacterales bacterium]|uniref:hypothetical protein n=1 Tax=Glycocaulis sp. TaxID=1969725 RepID=UPI003F9EEC0C
MRAFIAAGISAFFAFSASAQDMPAGQLPALDILVADEVPVNIFGEMSEGCRMDGDRVIDVVLGSLEHYGVNWVQGDESHTWRLIVTLNVFGEGGASGCAGNLLIEVYHPAELDLEFSSDTYRNDAILLRLENRFGPTLETGEALQDAYLNWLANELGAGWSLMLENRAAGE